MNLVFTYTNVVDTDYNKFEIDYSVLIFSSMYYSGIISDSYCVLIHSPFAYKARKLQYHVVQIFVG